jgi:hypothetical protein
MWLKQLSIQGIKTLGTCFIMWQPRTNRTLQIGLNGYKMKKIPTCTIHYDAYNLDFDCDAIHEEGCEDCLCNWYHTGGTHCPETGRKYSYEEAEKLFGEPECRN